MADRQITTDIEALVATSMIGLLGIGPWRVRKWRRIERREYSRCCAGSRARLVRKTNDSGRIRRCSRTQLYRSACQCGGTTTLTCAENSSMGSGSSYCTGGDPDCIKGKTFSLRGCVRSLGHVLEWRYETQTIPQRPDRRTVGCSGFPTPISQDRGKATYCRPTGGRQRHCVRSAQRLHVASHAA